MYIVVAPLWRSVMTWFTDCSSECSSSWLLFLFACSSVFLATFGSVCLFVVYFNCSQLSFALVIYPPDRDSLNGNSRGTEKHISLYFPLTDIRVHFDGKFWSSFRMKNNTNKITISQNYNPYHIYHVENFQACLPILIYAAIVLLKTCLLAFR